VLPSAFAADSVRLARFEREARTTAALAHPHICTIHDTGQDGTCSYYVSEYVEGETLQHRLVRGALPLQDALTIAEEILEALDYAHGRGVLHRDIKPSNIMLAATGVKLLDFGLADTRLSPVLAGAGAPRDTITLTAEGAFIGTVQYAAPEQLEGKPLDARTDLFGFGAVVYAMLAGERAFPGETPASVIAAILSRDPRPIGATRSDIAPSLERFVSRLLAKDPEDRWQTARDALAELCWIRTASSESSVVVRKPRRRAVWISTAAAMGAVAVLAARADWTRRAGPSASRAVPVVFDLGVAPGISPFGNMTAVSVSPDGRHLAFLAGGSQSQSLWIHDFTSGKARLVVGTLGALAPFWSPDSRAVGFELGGRLQRIDLAGESPATIVTPGQSRFGASWNADGTILFNGGIKTSLLHATIDGGSPTLATRLDPNHGELQHNWPQFLPDGQHFLFLSVNDRSPATQLWIASLGGDQRTHLLDDVSGAEYVAPGYLLFGREGLLYAQRFDPSAEVLSGDPTIVTESVAFNTNNGKSAFSASTGVLVYRSARIATIALLDRSGRRVAEIGEPGWYASPSISRDGTKVAVVKLNASMEKEVWVFDLLTHDGTLIASGSDWKSDPVWSPDGQDLVFQSIHEGAYRVLRYSRGRLAEELRIGIALGLDDWSPDGRFIAYNRVDSLRPNAPTSLTLFSMRGEPVPEQLLPQAPTARQARFSPDGRWIAYQARESDRWDVYLSSFPSGQGIPSGQGRSQVSTNGGVEPRWRGDSKELFYIAPDGSLMSVDVSGGATATSTPKKLCNLPLSGNRGPIPPRGPYDVTPDGQRIVLVSGGVDSEGSPITVLVNWMARLPQH
jgi:Tol biopolymer transport system component